MPKRLSVEEHFWSKVQKTPTCWLWTGCLSPSGYGKIKVRGVSQRAHRLAYELLVGPIPEGLQLDHVKARGCTNRNCVNPAHLEPVTRKVNILRGDSPAAIHARKTHCIRGHEFSVDNTRIDRRGYRYCRQCEQIYQHKKPCPDPASSPTPLTPAAPTTKKVA